MPAVVIVGAQWGDEGKGKIVDIYTEHADMVVRYGGGPERRPHARRRQRQAHRSPHSERHPARRDVVRPRRRAWSSIRAASSTEIDELETRGHHAERAPPRLRSRARDPAVPRARRRPSRARARTRSARPSAASALATRTRSRAAASRSAPSAISTRLRELVGARHRRLGADRSARSAARYRRAVDEMLAHARAARARASCRCSPTRSARRARGAREEERAPRGRARHAARRRSRHVSVRHVVDADGGRRVHRRGRRADAHRRGHRSREGVQRRASAAVRSRPSCTTTIGERIRKAGAEFGSVTGRPRRTGWLDLPALRYAARVNGLDGARPHEARRAHRARRDEGLRRLQDRSRARPTEFPIDELETAEPIYRSFPGWKEELGMARALDRSAGGGAQLRGVHRRGRRRPDRPRQRRLRRDETIVLSNPFAA